MRCRSGGDVDFPNAWAGRAFRCISAEVGGCGVRQLIAMVGALALIVGLGGEALARRGVAVQNYESVPIVRPDGASLTTKRVREAVVRAAQRNKWIVEQDSPGFVVATLSIKGRHSLTVAIRFSDSQFSIEYRGSNNLNYMQGPSGPVIHPAYNKEVKALLDAITAELSAV